MLDSCTCPLSTQAAILHHTSEYIDTLEQEKTRLLAQHCQLKRVIGSVLNGQQDIEGLLDHQLVKRIKTEHNLECSNSDSSDEGIQCHASPGVLIETEPNVDEMRSELVEVRKAVDRERKLRMQLEEQVKLLESQLYPERVKEIAQQVQVKFIEVKTLHHMFEGLFTNTFRREVQMFIQNLKMRLPLLPSWTTPSERRSRSKRTVVHRVLQFLLPS